jgi:hypothetical protein
MVESITTKDLFQQKEKMAGLKRFVQSKKIENSEKRKEKKEKIENSEKRKEKKELPKILNLKNPLGKKKVSRSIGFRSSPKRL